MSTSALVELIWEPERVDGALLGAFVPACREVAAIAMAANPAKHHIKVVLGRLGPTEYVLYGRGALAHLFEGGTQAHTEYPLYDAANAVQSGSYMSSMRSMSSLSRRTSRLNTTGGGANYAFRFTHGDGGFARGPIRVGGMQAEPFIHPAADALPVLYRRAAALALARMGMP